MAFIYFCSILTNTVCPRSSDPFYIVSYYIKWVTTSWTYSKRFKPYSDCELPRVGGPGETGQRGRQQGGGGEEGRSQVRQPEAFSVGGRGTVYCPKLVNN